MRHVTLRVLFVSLFLLAAPVVSAQQGLLTDRGFGAELGFASTDGTSELGVDLGYVVNKMIEAGFGITREHHDEWDWTNLYFTPRVRVYPVRQGDSMPVTLYAEGHYHFISVSADDFEDVSASGWGIGVGATHALTGGERLRIMPYASIAYTGYTEEYDYDMTGFKRGADAATYEETWNPIVFKLGVYGSVGVGSKQVYAAPFVEIRTSGSDSDFEGEDDTSTYVGLRIGLVLDR